MIDVIAGIGSIVTFDPENPMKIGQLAKMAGCQPVTVRYYERKGLLNDPKRSEENYRVYGTQDVERLLFIRKCRALGLTLAEITQLINVSDHPTMQCDEVNDCLDKHLVSLQKQIESLKQLELELTALRGKCTVPSTSEHCGVLAVLTAEQRAQQADEPNMPWR